MAAVKSAQAHQAVAKVCPDTTESLQKCSRPAIRREWRTMSRLNRNDYIAAVQCLSTQPSKVHTNGSLYDDFPRVHQATAPNAHKAAPFLPWHRYFVHAYETALKEQCGYKGVIPYWDWSQDWNNMLSAPVWAAEGGFGGDGASDTPITVGGGRCVRDGPFSTIEAQYYGEEAKAHCLSRGFATHDELLRIGAPISPDALETLRDNSQSFEQYALEIEHRAHTFVREGVQGDFQAYTGPYDPVFFLHHVNLDRLWAQWQASTLGGQTAYGGPKCYAPGSPAASLDDLLNVGGLLPEVPVASVMDTTAGIFCYQY
ncbi:Di-copper centre-containing protein [Massarina eburnea CBS 473.64]|uniref:Di-copper centre-containing protein n=1 Tax=Massarina eburnea CBS 473.64 TaxID=1395130 RepID=A0A6A6RFR4_9PLEO|nr:Di-copper centre-containing protein [Massarina eburnea CBS 473.64]